MKWKREKESNRRSRNIRERGREKWEEEERGVREGKPSLRNFTISQFHKKHSTSSYPHAEEYSTYKHSNTIC